MTYCPKCGSETRITRERETDRGQERMRACEEETCKHAFKTLEHCEIKTMTRAQRYSALSAALEMMLGAKRAVSHNHTGMDAGKGMLEEYCGLEGLIASIQDMMIEQQYYRGFDKDNEGGGE